MYLDTEVFTDDRKKVKYYRTTSWDIIKSIKSEKGIYTCEKVFDTPSHLDWLPCPVDLLPVKVKMAFMGY